MDATGMDVPHYQDGAWAPTPQHLDWADNEDFELWLKRAGYKEFTSVGIPDASYGIRAWAKKETPQYLIEFTDGNICPMATAQTVADALDVIAKWAPMVTAGIVGEVADGIWGLSPDGVVTHVMAAAELNAAAASGLANRERATRARRRAEVLQNRPPVDGAGT